MKKHLRQLLYIKTKFKVSQNHKMASVGRDLKDQVSNPLPQAGLPATRSSPRLDRLHLSWPCTPLCGIHNLSGQPLPAPHISLSKELPLILTVSHKRTIKQQQNPQMAPVYLFLKFASEIIMSSLKKS